jgi:ATP-dependent Clp protease ATP-binding subunit ClpA
VPDRFIRVDCAEYQMGHEIAKLIGAPPGYLGHRETEPVLSAARLGKNTSPDSLVSVIIFDEIEKAHSSLFRILLGVLDKGVLHLGDNTPVKLNN